MKDYLAQLSNGSVTTVRHYSMRIGETVELRLKGTMTTKVFVCKGQSLLVEAGKELAKV